MMEEERNFVESYRVRMNAAEQNLSLVHRKVRKEVEAQMAEQYEYHMNRLKSKIETIK